jgi:hypothetical protein
VKTGHCTSENLQTDLWGVSHPGTAMCYVTTAAHALIVSQCGDLHDCFLRAAPYVQMQASALS